MARMFHRNSGPSLNQKVFLATPSMGGMEPAYVYALFNSAKALIDAGIDYELAIFAGDCHVDDARNRLVRDFLETDCTDLIFLDADVRWESEDLIKLITYEKYVVAGVYPLKQADEGFPVMPLPGDRQANENGLVEVQGVPAGFLKISRCVLQTLADRAPKFKPKSDSRSMIPLIFERTLEDNRRWGGDYTFCRKWRAIGGQIYVDPEMRLEHSGTTNWNGSLGDFWRKEAGLEPARFKPLFDKALKTEKLEDFLELREAWGNPYAAPASLLQTAYKLAQETTQPILETGSGLSTLILNAANKEVYTLEHSLARYCEAKEKLRQYGLSDGGLIYAPLNPGNRWYKSFLHLQTMKFGMAICDGPPRNVNSRFALWEVMRKSIDNAIWLVDDCRETELFGRKMDLIEDIHPWLIGRPPNGN